MPVDLSASIFAQYKQARKRAEEAEHSGNAAEAGNSYRYAAEQMRKYAQYSRDAAVRKSRLDKAAALDNLAGRILKNGFSSTPARGKTGGQTIEKREEPSEDDYETEVMALIQNSQVKWDDIAGMEETKQSIKSAYGMALARKPDRVRLDTYQNILLYGPPGTGKTLLAAATAGSLDATFFNMKLSGVLSKYFGESTKLIAALYQAARKLNPAVIFLDEFESITPPRGTGESGAERRILSTLLAELAGMETKDDKRFILTLGATNVPWLLDDAILSRFPLRIYIPLPDEVTRREIFEIHLDRRGIKSHLSPDELVRRTQGFSGREIEQLCQIAVKNMSLRANPALLSAVDRGKEAVRAYEIKVEPLNEKDFLAAFEKIHPVANPAMLGEFERWSRQVQ